MGPSRAPPRSAGRSVSAQQNFARSISPHTLGGLQQQPALVRQSGKPAVDLALAQSQVQATADRLGELHPGRPYRAETGLRPGILPMFEAIEDGGGGGLG